MRPVLLTLHYDGGKFAGWQRQAVGRTVQAELEQVLARLASQPVRAHAAGRTDAGVHAAGMAVSCLMPDRWSPAELRRAVNALLPPDCWAADCREMRPGFHARTCAITRRYRYVLGTDAISRSPFRRRFEWALAGPLDGAVLPGLAEQLPGTHDFSLFSVRSSPRAHKRCRIAAAHWLERPGGHGFTFDITADRFLHHMVRMLVGTMVDIARDRRPANDMTRLLELSPGARTSPPAPPQGLYFLAAEYPAEWYL